MNVYVALGAWVLVVHRTSIATSPTEVAETVLGAPRLALQLGGFAPRPGHTGAGA